MPADQTVGGFLEVLAGPAAAPGGGSAAAAAGAMAAALVSMVCNLTLGKEKYAEVEPRLKEVLIRSEALRAKLTQLIQEDIDAFEAVMRAYRLPKNTPAQQAARLTAIQEGTKQAALTPLTTTRACAEVMALAKTAAELGNPNVITDGGVAALCAQAGLKGAALNVLINLGTIKDQTFVSKHQTELDQILTHYDTLANEVYKLVKDQL